MASAGNTVYCATTTGVFTYNKNDNSIERLSKVTGLSDVDIAEVSYNSNNNCVLIAYSNGNMDIIKEGKIINVSDIKRKQDLGNKSINSILMSGDLAYLSCGFGIVIMDLKKIEIKDTWHPSPTSAVSAVNDVALTSTKIYAATDGGVFSADLNNPILADFTGWTQETISNVTTRKFNTVCNFNGKLITNYSSSAFDQDSMYYFTGSEWKRYTNLSIDIKKIKSFKNTYLALVGNYNTSFRNTSDTQIGVVYNYTTPFPNDVDIDENNIAWIADGINGLVKSNNLFDAQIILPNGPPNNHVFQMDISNNVVWVAPGAFDGSFGNNWFRDGIYYFKDNEWKVYGNGMFTQLDSAFDLVTVKADPKDDNHIFAGGWYRGVVEINDDQFVANYWKTNSSLQNQVQAPTYAWVGTAGMDFDPDGNLWVSNSICNQPLSVKKADGTWKAFTLDGVPVAYRLGKVQVAGSGFKWVIVRRMGIGAYNDHKTIDDATDDEFKLAKFPYYDNGEVLQVSDILDFAEDQNGDIWMGTDKGVLVIYNGNNVFNADTVNTNRIKITMDGYTGYLLESEVVTAVAVDKANRKWLGTRNAGVFLVSADGTKQLEHFYTANSPLLSDNILSIAINHDNGEVFFGTDKGILSYKGTATEGATDCKEIYAYPNPVKPNYEGMIAIKGTFENSTVKITDMAGNLVYETTSLGGQAIWNGKTPQGERVASGVYNVFATTKDGQRTCFTKILVVN